VLRIYRFAYLQLFQSCRFDARFFLRFDVENENIKFKCMKVKEDESWNKCEPIRCPSHWGATSTIDVSGSYWKDFFLYFQLTWNIYNQHESQSDTLIQKVKNSKLTCWLKKLLIMNDKVIECIYYKLILSTHISKASLVEAYRFDGRLQARR
jgi:hypothetical protein